MTEFTETSEDLLRRVIQPRREDSHKGDNGVVCVVGGSRIFHGAPYFSSMAALRTGADLVYLGVPKLIAGSIRSLSPELIVFPIADAKLTTGAADALLKWLPETDSLVLGPGMGRQNLDGAKKIIRDLCLERKIRVSLDAEAQHLEIFSLIKHKECITTPHPGEFKRIFGVDAGNTVEERIESTKRKAAECGITILLKGAKSVITDGVSVYVNGVGSPGMTCGGIGDTISGVIGALIAQTVDTDVKSVEVAAAASYIVGLSGRRAVESKGFHITATDIISEIPLVLKRFDRVV
ncbi:MAG: NAD(P)H-hydrate dehydratase [Thaumarchaeota archaeon]|nr:NAD(P)H-hydrate dehydratase [Nitrososphaerota archaeon]